MDCVRQVRDTEFPDEVAVAMIRDAAGGKPAVLDTFAESFAGRDWEGDPLLVRVAELVSAAQSGTDPAPVDEATADAIRVERLLLNEERATGFELLATRQPRLRDLARRVSDATWRDEQDRNPPRWEDPPRPAEGVEVVPGVWASESTPGPVRWLLKRTIKTLGHVRVEPRNDRRWEDWDRSAADMRANAGTLAAIGQEVVRLVGPRADSDDRLIRTRVALVTARDHLTDLSGVRLADLRRRD